MPNGNSPTGEAAQTASPATGKWGLGREARNALLKDEAWMPRGQSEGTNLG